MTLDQLYSEIHDRQITVDSFSTRELVSASFPENWIVVDPRKIKSKAEEKVILAHEAGHCITGSFYNISSPLTVREKQEYKANAWAYNTLIPLKDLQVATQNGIIEIWDLAEFFGVPYEFMKKAAEYWQRKEMV